MFLTGFNKSSFSNEIIITSKSIQSGLDSDNSAKTIYSNTANVATPYAEKSDKPYGNINNTKKINTNQSNISTSSDKPGKAIT